MNSELDKLKVAQLRAIASRYDIRVPVKSKKSDLIYLISSRFGVSSSSRVSRGFDQTTLAADPNFSMPQVQAHLGFIRPQSSHPRSNGCA